MSSLAEWVNDPKETAALTIRDARKGTSFIRLKTLHGEKETLALIMIIVEEINDSVKTKEKFNTKDITECAYLLLTEYPNIKMEQLMHFAKEIKMGRFETFYRLDLPTFFQTLRKYTELVENDRHDEHLDNKQIN